MAVMDRTELRKQLESGLPVLIYDFDGREEETDMVFYAGSVTWKSVNVLRKEAGGLICYVTSERVGRRIGLTFFTDLVRERYPNLYKRPTYGDEPAFSLWVNHVGTRTGISDEDRAKTIKELHDVVELAEKGEEESARQKFNREFYSPGHVPILLSRGVSKRRGHTELTVALLELLGLPRSGVIAEMLDDGRSMSKEKVVLYAKNNGIPLIEGKELLKEVGAF